MGAELICTVRFKGTTAGGKARLETEVLHFRGGELRLAIPFKSMKTVTAKAGTLSVSFPDGTAAFALGDAAPKWAVKILHPPSRLQKIGVKPDWRVAAIGDVETGLPRSSLAEGVRVICREWPQVLLKKIATPSFSAS